MTGALLGRLLGVGLLLVRRSGPRAPQRTPDPRPPGCRARLLAEAGLTEINPAQLVALQVGLGLLAAVVVLLTTGTVTVSLAFGVFGAALRPVQVRRLALLTDHSSVVSSGLVAMLAERPERTDPDAQHRPAAGSR